MKEIVDLIHVNVEDRLRLFSYENHRLSKRKWIDSRNQFSVFLFVLERLVDEMYRVNLYHHLRLVQHRLECSREDKFIDIFDKQCSLPFVLT